MTPRDPELEELFTHPIDREVVELLRASRPGTPPLDASFKSDLRARLMSEARRRLPPTERRSWFAGLMLRPMPAFAAIAAGFLLVAAGFALVRTLRGTQSVTAIETNVQGKSDVRTAEPIKIQFRGAVDKTTAAQTVEIQPAAQYTTRWEGQTLVIIPLHPLAANTGYTVKVAPASDQPASVVRFVTMASPPPPVVPPMFRAENLTFLSESRIADPGAISSFTWAPDGVSLLVTRPPSERPSPSPTSSPAATSGASQGTTARLATSTEIWLLSPQGTAVRRLAPRGSDPSVAPSGGQFAFWRTDSSGEVSLMVSGLDEDGTAAVKVASPGAQPTQPPLWVGPDRLAYVDGGTLHLVTLLGSSVPTLRLSITGSLAASRDGRLLVAETPDGPVVYDPAARRIMRQLPPGASRFAWSPRGDLAYVTPGPVGAELFVLSPADRDPRLVVSAPGDATSDVNWAPDANSLLIATRSPGVSPPGPRALLVNADGVGGLTVFGSSSREYSAPRWSPLGTAVAFIRRDETGRMALWRADLALGEPAAADLAQVQAQAEVDKFMTLRLRGNLSEAQAELGPEARETYETAGVSLPAGSRFYKVGVQLVTPNKFLIGVRIVFSDPKSKQETSFVEEHVTVVRIDAQPFRIEAVEIGSRVELGRGPSVVSVAAERSGDAPVRDLLVRFDADLDPATVSSDAVYLRGPSGDRVAAASFSFDPASRVVDLKLPKLSPGKYQLVVSTAVTDWRGQPLPQEYQSPFVVED